MKKAIYVVAPLMCVVAVVLLLILRSKPKEPKIRDNVVSDLFSHRRYSTSDEMKYILYGVGDQFSFYDQQLLDYIRSHISQASLTKPRHLQTRKSDRSQMGQSRLVDKLLFGRRNGFFIECGAYNGDQFSNSLFFELERNWTGLLIEADPWSYGALLNRNRRSYALNVCLSTTKRPSRVRLQQKKFFSKITSGAKGVSVGCFPLNAITAALGVSRVDYLSLDVEGPELEILRTIDWKRLRIDVITVEYRILTFRRADPINKPATLKKLSDLRELFRETGLYREVGLLPNVTDAEGLDVVFARK